MTVVPQRFVIKISPLLDNGRTPYWIDSKDIADLRTAQRLNSVRKGFKTGEQEEEIARKSGYVLDRIKEFHKLWDKYDLAEKRKSVDWRYHITALTNLSTKLRDCTYNPRINQQSTYGNIGPVWCWMEEDWRLIPCALFSRTAPMLQSPFNKDWEPGISHLKEHISGKSHLYEINIELHQKADELYSAIKEAAEKIDGLICGQIWADLSIKLDAYTVEELVPNIDSLPKSITPFPYDSELCGETVERLINHIPEFNNRWIALEQLLQDFWDSLDFTEIKKTIEQGKCPACPSDKS